MEKEDVGEGPRLCPGSAVVAEDGAAVRRGTSMSQSSGSSTYVCHDILLAKPPGASPASSNWVASANGTATWLLVMMDTGAGLLDLLTGALTMLPAYHDKMWQMESPHGIIYTDGTVFLYNFAQDSGRIAFTPAILRPGDVAWTQVKTMLDYMPSMRTNSCPVAAYHDGKILMCADLDY